MSTPLLNLLSALSVTLSLLPTVAAAPIPVSPSTAIAFIASLVVVPSLFILLFVVKYFYVKNRKTDAASEHTHSSNSSSQLRTGHCQDAVSWDLTGRGMSSVHSWPPRFSGLGNQQKKIRIQHCGRNKLALFVRPHSSLELDQFGYIALGSFLSEIYQPLISPASTENSVYSKGWVELPGLRGYAFRLSRILCIPQTSHSFTL